jgi:hypothetical protein
MTTKGPTADQCHKAYMGLAFPSQEVEDKLADNFIEKISNWKANRLTIDQEVIEPCEYKPIDEKNYLENGGFYMSQFQVIVTEDELRKKLMEKIDKI